MLRAGLGVTLMDTSIRLSLNNNFKIVKVDDDWMYVGMAYRRDNPNPAVRLFMDIMELESNQTIYNNNE